MEPPVSQVYYYPFQGLLILLMCSQGSRDARTLGLGLANAFGVVTQLLVSS